MTDVTFRLITLTDLPLLDMFNGDCATADGNLAIPETAYADLIADAWCAMPDGQIIAAGWMKRQDSTALLRGKVHPAYRHQGIGTALLDHLEKQAAETGDINQYVIRSEALGADAETFYARQGYRLDFVEVKMRHTLSDPLPEIETPPYIPWMPETAITFHTIYADSFRERPGFQGDDADEWIADHIEDEAFRPDLSLLAQVDGQPAGFVTMFVEESTSNSPTRGFLSQVGTPPAFRGKGIGAGLMVEVMRRLQSEAVTVLDLHVNENNPHAIALYERLGFERVGRRGKYSRLVS